MFQMMSRAERTPLQLARSTINLLNLLLFFKIFLLVTSLSFIFVALKDLKEDQMGTQHVALRDRTFLLQNGLYVGCVSLVSGLQLLSADLNWPQLTTGVCIVTTGIANALALLGLKLWRRALLVPQLPFLQF